MRKGINQWSFPEDASLADCFSLCQKYGVEGFEPAFALTGALSMETADAAVAAIRRQAQDAGVALTSLASGAYWSVNPVSDDDAVRAHAKQILKRQLEAASLLGVSAILFVPGAVGTGFFGRETVRYDVALDRAIALLRDVESHARACGVAIGIENVWNNFLLSPVEMKNVIDAVGSDYVGAYFDVGNVVRTGSPEQWIEILGTRIKAVHIKDFSRAIDTLQGFCDLLEGDVDFPAVMKALRETGYGGYLVAEMSNHSGEHMIQKTAIALERILAM